ncbi:MAG: hypothetical protein JWP20_2456, partial [Roseomonas sp.]|nr:hypothetical protein [Roseomonas sp.]
MWREGLRARLRILMAEGVAGMCVPARRRLGPMQEHWAKPPT